MSATSNAGTELGFPLVRMQIPTAAVGEMLGWGLFNPATAVPCSVLLVRGAWALVLIFFHFDYLGVQPRLQGKKCWCEA